MMRISKLLKFLKFTQKFRKTQRNIYAVDEGRMENDTEHSYQLALLAWYIIETQKLKLNLNLVIKYTLIHDLEEALTGDKSIFDSKGRVNKDKLEEKARKRIAAMFPDWNEYRKLSRNYKLQKDEEGKFVNGLDKVLPVLNIYLDNGKTWKREGTTFEKLVNNKRETVKRHSFSESIWPKIERLLRSKKSKLFGKN